MNREQVKKDGAIGSLTRGAANVVVIPVAIAESVSRGDLKAPVANRISDAAAKAGKAVGNYMQQHPVQTAVAIGNAVYNATQHSKADSRITALENKQTQSQQNQSRR